MKIVNLTNTPIVLATNKGRVVLPSMNREYGSPRASIEAEPIGELNVELPENKECIIPVVETHISGAKGVPEAKDGIIYIVSRQVAEACSDREDFYIICKSRRTRKGVLIKSLAKPRKSKDTGGPQESSE